MTTLRTRALITFMFLFVVSPLLSGSPAQAAPSALDALPETTSQAILVTARDWDTTHAVLRTYERRGDTWVEVVGRTPARIGSTGMIPGARRIQGSGKTPAGTYAITSAFGRKANPGTSLPYTHLDRNDTWPYWREAPDTYNLLQTAPYDTSGFGPYVEHLWGKGRQYDYVAVLDYNLPSDVITGSDGIRRARTTADVRRGGGIFLHVTNGKPTAGCIAVPEPVMRGILRWLDPARQPVIITRVR